ncbi:MAG: hypothetical protein EBS00_06255, partial [Verrucomicrobia bacterium]|nr:hypothetical protein [Verrucomicrobiota bacterium]
RSQGFLDAEILEFDPEKICVVKDLTKPNTPEASGWIDLVYSLKEGRRYFIGNLSVVGNRLASTSPTFSNESLLKVVNEPSLRRGAHKPEVDRFVKGEPFSSASLDVAADVQSIFKVIRRRVPRLLLAN